MATGGEGRSVRVVVLAVGIAVLLALGLWVFLGSGTPLPPADKAVQRYSSLDDYNVTYRVTYDRPTGRRTVEVHVTVSPDSEEIRSEVLAPPDRAGNLYVFNGTHLWIYNASANHATVVSRSEPVAIPQYKRMIRRAVAGARGEGPSSRVSPLPVVPSAPAGSAVENASGQLEASYAGTDTVAGRRAHVITMTPADGTATVIRNQTLWLDAEHFVPLRARLVLQFGGNRTVITQRATAFALDPDLPAGVFTFEPPEGVTLERSRSTRYDSRAALRKVTDIPVPDPAVPREFAFQRAQFVQRPNRSLVFLRYTSGVNVISVAVGSGFQFDPGTGEKVSLGNRTGWYRRSVRVARVVWRCGGYEYTVAGTVSREALVDVARSVACPTARTAST